MNWIALSLLSAFFLGLYDLCKKHAVHDNAVLMVLFWSTSCGALVWGGLMVVEGLAPGHLPADLRTTPLDLRGHGLMFVKALIVAASWICGYFALKHLPVSFGSPIRASGPLWTWLGAVILLAERPTWMESLGILLTLGSFFGLSVAGRHEGIHFHKDKWVWMMVAATLLGSASGLWDKYLLGRSGYTAATVQAWFSVYLVVLFLPLAVGWKRRWWPRHEFHWRWSIPLIAASLLLADYIYFSALRDPQALVSLVSSLRRGSTLASFAGGIWLFREPNGLRKLPAVLGILAGMVITMLGGHRS